MSEIMALSDAQLEEITRHLNRTEKCIDNNSARGDEARVAYWSSRLMGIRDTLSIIGYAAVLKDADGDYRWEIVKKR